MTAHIRCSEGSFGSALPSSSRTAKFASTSTSTPTSSGVTPFR